jgi:membrane protease YdiL (CAAX protease family)
VEEKTMESNNKNVQSKKNFQLHEHPWLALVASVVTTVLTIGLTGMVIFTWIGLSGSSLAGSLAQECSFKIISSFIIAPFILLLPKGKRTYGQFLDDIGLTRVRPFFRLVLLALSCYLILALSQIAASFVYRLFEGKPVTWGFVRMVFELSRNLAPDSASLLFSIAGALEEVGSRGIILTVFLNRYSEWKSIIFSSLGFGLMHLLNLTNGADLALVLGQVAWAFIIGLFYGYVFVRTRSLLPSMVVHYLSNAFISSLLGYLQMWASVEVQVVYGIIFSFGIIPTALMILWTKFYTSRWLPGSFSRPHVNA